jgi:hypothetical protein
MQKTNLSAQIVRYDMQWANLLAGTQKGKPLTFGQIPWPVFDPPPKQPSDLTDERIRRFLSHPDRSQSVVKVVRDEMLRWHPDKFQACVLVRVDTSHTSEVTAAMHAVITTLTAMNSEKAMNLEKGCRR